MMDFWIFKGSSNDDGVRQTLDLPLDAHHCKVSIVAVIETLFVIALESRLVSVQSCLGLAISGDFMAGEWKSFE